MDDPIEDYLSEVAANLSANFAPRRSVPPLASREGGGGGGGSTTSMMKFVDSHASGLVLDHRSPTTPPTTNLLIGEKFELLWKKSLLLN